VKRAVRRHGAKLIVIDPRKIGLVDYADIWLRPKPGTNVAVLNGLMNVIIEEDLYATEYVAGRTEGFEAMKAAVAKYTPDHVEKITGVPGDDLRTAARLYAAAKSASILYAMGITQHSHGTDNVKSCANLAMLCGNVGIEGVVSIPSGVRITSRAPATWARSPMSSQRINRLPMMRHGKSSKRHGTFHCLQNRG